MYTSGDWELIKMKSVIGNYMIRSSEATKGIAITFSSLGEEEEANARLMVAAPKLKEELQKQADRIAYLLDSLVERRCEIEKTEPSSQMGFEHGLLNGEYDAIRKFLKPLQDMEMEIEAAIAKAEGK